MVAYALQYLHVLYLNLFVLALPECPVQRAEVTRVALVLLLLCAHYAGDLLKEQPVLPLYFGVLGFYQVVPFGVVDQYAALGVVPRGSDRLVRSHLLYALVVPTQQTSNFLPLQVIGVGGLVHYNKFIG